MKEEEKAYVTRAVCLVNSMDPEVINRAAGRAADPAVGAHFFRVAMTLTSAKIQDIDKLDKVNSFLIGADEDKECRIIDHGIKLENHCKEVTKVHKKVRDQGQKIAALEEKERQKDEEIACLKEAYAEQQQVNADQQKFNAELLQRLQRAGI